MTALATSPVRFGHPAARRTLVALLACALGAMPLKALLADNAWLIESWLAMVIVIAPAALLRLRRAPSALDIWPGVILLVPWLTTAYVPQHAFARVIPTRATLHDVGDLMNSLHRTTSNEVAPIHSTVAVRLVIAALLGLLAALIDLIAVVGRRGALAGVPLLVVYTVSGAVPRSPVQWLWFSVAAAGYLLLLALDAAEELREWGRRVSRPGGARTRPSLGFSAHRIGIIAILLAVILPLAIPAHPRNLIADAFHGAGRGGIGNFGATTGGSSISPFAALKGQLIRERPVDMMTVHIDSASAAQPFYVRLNVLDRFSGDGWGVSGHGSSEPIELTSFPTAPLNSRPRTESYTADITITGMTGNAPIFSVPRSLRGVGNDVEWSPQDQVLVGGTVHRGQELVEEVAQPQPSIADLESAPEPTDVDLGRWLALPDLPSFVTDLVGQLIRGKSTPFEKARAIFQFFTDPANDFVYSLHTTAGDSGNDLVDFLQTRSGFCQQYAAAMGVMLRAAGVPTRLVLGYMHPPPDARGNFKVTTFDAHAWVEAYFSGAGWIPFDPTPVTGLVGGKKTDLSWAPHSYPGDGPTRQGSAESSAAPHHATSAPGGGASTAPKAKNSAASSHRALIITGLVLLVLLGVGLTPAVVRSVRRRRRLMAARSGDPDPLWAELSDTAVDLGYVWSESRTPRQVSTWLAGDAADTAPALKALAVAVEERRYAPRPHPAETGELARGLLDVADQLWSRRSARSRLRARLWPASLGWRLPGRVRRIAGRKH